MKFQFEHIRLIFFLLLVLYYLSRCNCISGIDSIDRFRVGVQSGCGLSWEQLSNSLERYRSGTIDNHTQVMVELCDTIMWGGEHDISIYSGIYTYHYLDRGLIYFLYPKPSPWNTTWKLIVQFKDQVSPYIEMISIVDLDNNNIEPFGPPRGKSIMRPGVTVRTIVKSIEPL